MAKLDEGYSDVDGLPSEKFYEDNLRIEPSFKAFICPLTKKVMRDPVILETGLSFERKAIEEWFSECSHVGGKNICPISQKELTATCLTPNVGLHDAIEEWNQRNEAARLNIARLTLTPKSTEGDILRALSNIQRLCQKEKSHKVFVCSESVMPTIVYNLGNRNGDIQCKVLETLRVVAEGDCGDKEAVAAGSTISAIVRFLARNSPQQRQEAVSLLFELSKSEPVAEKIGKEKGAILVLHAMANGKSDDAVVVDKAERTLQNLEKCEKNVLQMAENGRLEPLLRRLLEDSPENRLGMVSYLGRLALSNEMKALVTRTAGSALVNLIINGSKEERAAAVKALNQISSCELSAKLLVEAGILPPLVSSLVGTDQRELPVNMKVTLANILVNIVTHCADSASVSLDYERSTLVSEDNVTSLLHLISSTDQELGCMLLEALVVLSTNVESAQNIAGAVKRSGAIINMIQFIEAPKRDLQAASIKFLCNVCPYMKPELTVSLCDNSGYLARLIEIISEGNAISEVEAAAITFLAKLPDNDIKFIRKLMREKAFEKFLGQLLKIQRGEARGGSRYVAAYSEGIAQVISKLVYNLESGSHVLSFVRDNDIAALFVDLLWANATDNVKIICASALEKLSQRSKGLIRPDPSSSYCKLTWSKKKPILSAYCHVHQGHCSMKENFCLVEGHAIEKLISCLDHPNKKVIQTSLEAICTLLDDDVPIQQVVFALARVGGTMPIMQVLKHHDDVSLQQTAVWAVERLLRVEDIAREASDDQSIVNALLLIFQHGDVKSKQIAGRALEHIRRLPVFSSITPKSK